MVVPSLRQTKTIGRLVVFVCLWTLAASIAVIETSQCVDDCDNNSRKTTADDLVCPDAAFDTTGKGVTMKNCLLCQSTGTAYIIPTRNDVYTFLYNQKYTLQTCLYDRAGETSILGCEDPCLPLKPVLEAPWYKEGGFTPLYDYCSINGGAFRTYAGKCSSCLKGKDGTVTLGNFMDILELACQTQPDPSLNQTVNVPQSPFLTTSTSTTSATPTPDPTESSSSAAQSDSPGADPTSSPAQPESTSSGQMSNSSNSGLSTGAKAGIGAGVGAGALLVIAAVGWVFYSRKKKQVKGRDGYVPPWPQDKKYPISQDYRQPPPLSEPHPSTYASPSYASPSYASPSYTNPSYASPAYASPTESEPVEMEWQQRKRVELPT